MRMTGFLAAGLASAALAAPPSIETFASRPRVEGVTISADGRYLAVVMTHAGKGAVLVRERSNAETQNGRMVLAEPEHFRISRCRFANNTRLLCSFRAMGFDRVVYAVARLVAVDADGRNMKVLVQNPMWRRASSRTGCCTGIRGISTPC